MKRLVILVAIAAPAAVCGQYIGNPCGKAVPRGAPSYRATGACGLAGFDLGLGRFKVDADYDVVSGGLFGTLRETSELRETYFAFSGGVNVEGFELEGRLGGTWIELREDLFTEDPFQDGAGVLVGLGLRYGFSPVEFLRLGLGGQFEYSYTEGDTRVSDGHSVWKEVMTLDLFRGQLFAGASLDLEAGRDLVFSPYAGGGLEFLKGELYLEDWHRWFDDEVADFDEKHVGFIFGGLDLHIGGRARIGLEARTNFDGWLAQVSLGIRF